MEISGGLFCLLEFLVKTSVCCARGVANVSLERVGLFLFPLSLSLARGIFNFIITSPLD